VGEDINSMSMYEMIKSQKSLSKAPLIEGYKFVQTLYSEGECAILPAAGSVLNDGEKTLEISGTAMFKKDKLVGFLDGDDTKYFLLVKNMVQSCVLPEMGKGENVEHSISLEVFENKGKIKPRIQMEKSQLT
jgi:spore germination protein KC